MAVSAPIFTELLRARYRFVKNAYTEFHENLTNGLVGNTRSQTDSQSLDIRSPFSYFVKNAYKHYPFIAVWANGVGSLIILHAFIW